MLNQTQDVSSIGGVMRRVEALLAGVTKPTPEMVATPLREERMKTTSDV